MGKKLKDGSKSKIKVKGSRRREGDSDISPPLFQIDNLLRFLNAMHDPCDLLALGALDSRKESLAAANAILAWRLHHGPLIRIEDLAGIKAIRPKALKVLLAAATYRIVPDSMAILVDDLPWLMSEASLSPVFALPLKFPLAIRWQPLPAAWAVMRDFVRLLGDKRKWLGDEIDDLKKLRKRQNKMLEGLLEDTPRDEWDDSTEIAVARGNVQDTQKRIDELQREIDALNKAVKNGDKKAAWQIIKPNVEEKIRQLIRERDAELAEDPPDTKTANVRDEQARLFENLIENAEAELNAGGG